MKKNDNDKTAMIEGIKLKFKKHKLSNQTMFDDISKTFNDKVEDMFSKYEATSSTINDIIINLQNVKAELNKNIDDVSSYLATKIKSLETNDQNLLERTKDLDKRLASTTRDLSDAEKIIDKMANDQVSFNKLYEEYKASIKDTLKKFDKNFDGAYKEAIKSNDNFIAFKEENKQLLVDIECEQTKLNDKFEDLRETLNKSKEELYEKITSETSILSADIKYNVIRIYSRIQNLSQEANILRLKLDTKAEILDVKELKADIANETSKV